jgi:hypothetical protein
VMDCEDHYCWVCCFWVTLQRKVGVAKLRLIGRCS